MDSVWKVSVFGDTRNAVFLLLVGLTSLLWLIFYKRAKSQSYPPYYSGYIPWLGCAIEFGKAPLHFIEKAKAKMGPVFTLLVAGKRMTFLMEAEDFKYFFNSDNTDFQGAVQQPVKNAAAVSVESFYKYHTKIHDTVKGRLAPALLEPIGKSLSEKFSKYIKTWKTGGPVELNDIVRETMYKAVIENLFGDGVLPTESEELFKELEKNFVKFDDEFEYGSQLPDFLLKDWSYSKHWLLKTFKKVVEKLEKSPSTLDKETLLETLVKSVDRPHAPNYGLLLMWASLANAIPITFWTLAFIFSHSDVLKELKAEVDSALGTIKNGAPCLTENHLQAMPGIKRAILEAIRLRSPGVITRKVKKDFFVKGFHVPSGDHLMLSPYWAHRNPKYFPQPDMFLPNRWKDAELERNLFLDGFVAFGGGRYQCPGRWFALLEIHIYVALVLYHFDMELLDPLPINSPLHLVGTQQPDGPLRVKVTKKL